MNDQSGDGTYDPPQRLRRLPSWLASDVARRGAQLVAEALAEDGIRRHHFAVLVALAEHGPASQASLGRRLWIDRSDMHAVLRDLERAGLVARVRDERDRRRNVVALSAAGEAATARLEARVEAAQEALLAPLSVADRRQLVRLLVRVSSEHAPARARNREA